MSVGHAGVNTINTSLYEICKLVNKKEYLIPEFQRKYDWNKSPDRKTKLFDSLFSGVYIGNVVLGAPSFTISCREFDGRPPSGKGSRKKLDTPVYTKEFFKQNPQTVYSLILDGQQRITTIWRALEGHDQIYFNAKKIPVLDLEDTNLSNWVDEVSITVPIEKQLHISVFDVARISKLALGEQMVELNLLLNKQPVFESTPPGDPARKSIEIHYQKMYELINEFLKDKTVCIQTKIDSDLSVFVKYFERANSTPFILNFVDILIAKIFEDFKLRPRLEQFVEKSNTLGYITKLHENSTAVFENLVRMVAISNGIKPSKSEMLENLEAKHFESQFGIAEKCFHRANQLLHSMSLIHKSDDLPYPNMILPMMVFMSEIHDMNVNNVSAEQKNMINDWFLRSGFTERYSKKAGEMLDKDVDAFRLLGKNPQYEIYSNKEYKESFSNSRLKDSDALIGFTSRAGGIPKAMYAWDMVNAQGIHDLKNGNKVTTDNPVDKHHIFPKNFIDSKGTQLEKDHVHSLMNFVRITKTLNVQILDQDPQSYLNDISHSKLDDILLNHQIPVSIRYFDQASHLMPFLEERSKIVFPAIEKFTKFL